MAPGLVRNDIFTFLVVRPWKAGRVIILNGPKFVFIQRGRGVEEKDRDERDEREILFCPEIGRAS